MCRVSHEFPAVYDEGSRILILGSFPSVKSREVKFYYGHPQNRFWKLMEEIYGVKLESVEDKRRFLLANHLALWDVIESCEIDQSSDASIRNVKVNDILSLVSCCKIEKIIVNGKKAEALYNRFVYPLTKMACVCLPSTSSANAMWKFDDLLDVWKRELLF